MKQCNNCRAQVDDDTKYCPYCGSRLEENNQENTTYYDYYDNNDNNHNNDDNHSHYDSNNIYNATSSNQSQNTDGSSTALAILSFFFPLVGLILFLIWHSDMPLKAKSCGIGALIGFISNILLGICCSISWISALFY